MPQRRAAEGGGSCGRRLTANSVPAAMSRAASQKAMAFSVDAGLMNCGMPA